MTNDKLAFHACFFEKIINSKFNLESWKKTKTKTKQNNNNNKDYFVSISVNVFADVIFKYNLMSLTGDELGPYFNVSSEIDTGSSTRETFTF